MTGHRSALSTTVQEFCRWMQHRLTPFGEELRQRWQLHVIIALVVAASYQHLLFNVTPSLPYVLAVLERGATVERGDLIVFRFEGGEIGPY